MKKKLGLEAELVRSSGGVYEITVDGRVLFSKRKTGRFPDEDTEIVAPLGARLNRR